MKRTKKRVIALVMVMLTVLGIFGSILARAEEEPVVYDGIKSISLYAVKPQETNFISISGVLNKKQIKNLKCSNSKVASVSIKERYGGCYLAIVPQKAGKIRISFTAKYGSNLQYSKKLNFRVTVLKYENPCKSFKIGSKQYAALFNNNPHIRVKAQNKKLKVNIKPNKGWLIKKIDAFDDSRKEIRNGDKINMKIGEVSVIFQKKGTHKEQAISLGFGFGVEKADSNVYWV